MGGCSNVANCRSHFLPVYGFLVTHKLLEYLDYLALPTVFLTKWLVKRFETFPKFQTLNIKNSTELIKKLEVKVESDDVLVSFDVTSNVPKYTVGESVNQSRKIAYIIIL